MQDFTVFEGIRTPARQANLVRLGYSQTTRSYHLPTDVGDVRLAHAVDLVPWIGGRAVWDPGACEVVAGAVRAAAIELNIRVIWGGSWTVLNDVIDTASAIAEYIARKRSRGERPFIDRAHFQTVTR
jgi:peptidoglycan L-alanyl-D-glutamate endopeptidase CwlK